MTELPRPVADLDRLQAALQGLIEAVRDEQWPAPTPCTEWDVRALVNHVVTGTVLFDTILRRTEPPDRSIDRLGDNPPAAFRDAAASLLDVLSRPGVLEDTFPTFLGEQTGESIAGMRMTEYLVHGWDLARATGQRSDVLPADLAAGALEGLRARFRAVDRSALPIFGAERQAPPGAPAIDQLAAFLGRDV